MSGFSAFELWDTAVSKSHNPRFLRLALLSEAYQGNAAEQSSLTSVLQVLSSTSYSELFVHNNAFFWYAVDHCARVIQSAPLTAEAEQRLASLAFDAFFHRLPDSFDLSLGADNAHVIALPELRLRSEGRVSRISKQLPDMVLFGGADEATVDVAAPEPDFRLRTQSIAGNPESKLLLDSGINLFNASYRALVIERLDADAGAILGQDISEALAFLNSLDPVLASRIGRAIDWYIPVRSADPQMHISFSVPKLAGVIFLSQPTPQMGVPAWLKIGEVLVHEFAHNELNLYQESEQLFKDDPLQRFYSPWRPDPRPLNGLFHGIYSFWHVAEFFRCTLNSGPPTNLEAGVRQSHQRALRQLRIALWQVPLDRLTSHGRRIIDFIAKGVNDQFQIGNLEVVDPDLQAHVAQWRTSNPNYSNRLRLT